MGEASGVEGAELPHDSCAVQSQAIFRPGLPTQLPALNPQT